MPGVELGQRSERCFKRAPDPAERRRLLPAELVREHVCRQPLHSALRHRRPARVRSHHLPRIIDLSSPIQPRPLDALAAIGSYSCCRRLSDLGRNNTSGGTTMTRTTFITTLAVLAIMA